MNRPVLSLFTAIFSLAASAAVPLRWTVETSRATPVTFDEFEGGTYALEAALNSYGKPLEIEGDPNLYWQTNGMGDVWWIAPASRTNNLLRATWSPTNETAGARTYACFIGVSGTVYNAAFTLRLRHSPGYQPNTLRIPTPTVDCAAVTFLNPTNAPWSTISCDTNAVNDLIGLYDETNLTARFDAKIYMPEPWLPTNLVLTTVSNGVAWLPAQGGGAIGTLNQIQDDDGNWHNIRAKLNPSGQIVAAIEQETAPHIEKSIVEEELRAKTAENALHGEITNETARATSAELALEDALASISSIGRFLSTWNGATGRPGTEPQTETLEYLPGDYYIVGKVADAGSTNYVPSGTVYARGVASTNAAEDAVAVNDIYRHTDDGGWAHVQMSGVAVTFDLIAGEPTDNARLAHELLQAGLAKSFDVGEVGGEYVTDRRYEDLLAAYESGHYLLANLATTNLSAVLGFTSVADVADGPSVYSNAMVFSSRHFTGDTGGADLYLSVYTNATGTCCALKVIPSASGLVKDVVVRGVGHLPDTAGVVDLGDLATSNELYVVTTNLEAMIVAETNRAATAQSAISHTFSTDLSNPDDNIYFKVFTIRSLECGNSVSAYWLPKILGSSDVWSYLSEGANTVKATSGREINVNVHYYEQAGEMYVQVGIDEPEEAWLFDSRGKPGKTINMTVGESVRNIVKAMQPGIVSDRVEVSQELRTAAIITNAVITEVATNYIAAERLRAQLAEADLAAMIVAETNRAQLAETDLAAMIVAETNRAQIAETDLAAMIVAETNRAQVAETALDASVNIKIDAATATNIAASASVTNAGAVAAAKAYSEVFREKTDLKTYSMEWGDFVYSLGVTNARNIRWIGDDNVWFADYTDTFDGRTQIAFSEQPSNSTSLVFTCYDYGTAFTTRLVKVADGGSIATSNMVNGIVAPATNATLAAATNYTDAATNATLTAANAYTDDHADNTNNPHGVTAAQVGALTQSDADALYAPTSTAVTVASHASQLSQLSQTVERKIDAQAATNYTDAATNAAIAAANAYTDRAVVTNYNDLAVRPVINGTVLTGGVSHSAADLGLMSNLVFTAADNGKVLGVTNSALAWVAQTGGGGGGGGGQSDRISDSDGNVIYANKRHDYIRLDFGEWTKREVSEFSTERPGTNRYVLQDYNGFRWMCRKYYIEGATTEDLGLYNMVGSYLDSNATELRFPDASSTVTTRTKTSSQATATLATMDDLDEYIDGALYKSDVVDALNSSDDEAPLSANQGRVLNAKFTNGSVTKVGTSTVGGTLKPMYLNAGTPAAGTQLYARKATVNGTDYAGVIRTVDSDLPSIYAPTGTGSNGQFVKSTGSGSPVWASIDKSDVGLGNVNNTSDAAKPVSTATQTALDAKQNKVSALGSTTTPVYVSSAGTFSACGTYAGGTAVTLNGTSKAGSTASFYAPTASGTSGDVLKSSGSGAPAWRSSKTCLLTESTYKTLNNQVLSASVNDFTFIIVVAKDITNNSIYMMPLVNAANYNSEDKNVAVSSDVSWFVFYFPDATHITSVRRSTNPDTALISIWGIN